ncbi:MAG: tetratricopeptide repeat protein [Microgenomates group bacterium]
MARKILKSSKTKGKKIKFYFPKKINYNPFSYLDKKAKRIPKNILLAFLFLVVSFFLLKSENKRINQRVLGLQTQLKADQKTAFDWEQILAERPDYRDGWIQLAAIYHRSGNKEKAKEALLRAKVLDPNNETILSFEKLLEGQE